MSVRICILDGACVSLGEDEISAFGEAEAARLKEINNPGRRQESEAGLAALLRALDGREFCGIVREADGKPRFERDIGLDFNISHSGSLCVAALCDGETRRVGIDIECVREERRETIVRIAQRYFDQKEKESLLDGASLLEFYKIWTAKEAAAKLLGMGLSRMLGEKSQKEEKLVCSHFLVEYSGERYILCLCAEGQSVPDFITCNDIDVMPF